MEAKPDSKPRIVPMPLDLVWDDLRPRLEKLRARFSLEWRPEDVYMEVRNGRFVIYTDPDAPGSYAIMQQRPIAHHPEMDEIFIWIVIGEGENVIQRYQDALDALAREAGASRFVFESPRTGFQVLPGWKLQMYQYHRYL